MTFGKNYNTDIEINIMNSLYEKYNIIRVSSIYIYYFFFFSFCLLNYPISCHLLSSFLPFATYYSLSKMFTTPTTPTPTPTTPVSADQLSTLLERHSSLQLPERLRATESPV